LALVQNGDRIRLSVAERSIELNVSAEELERRKAQWVRPVPQDAERGYRKLFFEQVTQADKGCDFEFLRPPQMIARVPARD
jgi:dihydroxy-acid dehydratase